MREHKKGRSLAAERRYIVQLGNTIFSNEAMISVKYQSNSEPLGDILQEHFAHVRKMDCREAIEFAG